jgi:tetraacyldisaccharide 4'-kinase
MIFKDHHKFAAEDFANVSDDKNIIMTYKDAVKCKDFANKNWWYLDIDLDFDVSALNSEILPN